MRKLFVLLPMLVVCLAAAANAQEEAEPEPEPVSLPDYVMKQVVERIVIEHFSSTRRKGEMYLSETNIKREWVPKIKKIEFVFVTDADGREVHYFREPQRVGSEYRLDFGWGDPDCNSTGDTWQFRIVDGVVRDIRQTAGGWGTGCIVSSCGF